MHTQTTFNPRRFQPRGSRHYGLEQVNDPGSGLLTHLGHSQVCALNATAKGKLSGFHPQLHKTTGIYSPTPTGHESRLY